MEARGRVVSAGSDLGFSQDRFAAFVAEVWAYHRTNRRDLPWRHTRDPYEILVSEFMLQQTQVARVLRQYPAFLAAFPTVQDLASADIAAVLAAWQGLGYNRRALSLHRAAITIIEEYGGLVPSSAATLRGLPGIGAATAAAVSAFAFARAEPFIETNIRSAFIHFFCQDRDGVSDADLLPLVEATMDRDDPREWFYALMDYGVWVKKEYGNPSRLSKHHSVQSPFAGSRREARARILRAMLAAAPAPVGASEIATLLRRSGRQPDESLSIADDLVREGFLEKDGAAYRVAGAGDPASGMPD
jgi:A/G-specific adenine glycosylase